ncbi:Uncharacterised protein [Legionella parisiensis]|nr:Uncharacterised protein [Legionella parisiensis]
MLSCRMLLETKASKIILAILGFTLPKLTFNCLRPLISFFVTNENSSSFLALQLHQRIDFLWLPLRELVDVLRFQLK